MTPYPSSAKRYTYTSWRTGGESEAVYVYVYGYGYGQGGSASVLVLSEAVRVPVHELKDRGERKAVYECLYVYECGQGGEPNASHAPDAHNNARQRWRRQGTSAQVLAASSRLLLSPRYRSNVTPAKALILTHTSARWTPGAIAAKEANADTQAREESKKN